MSALSHRTQVRGATGAFGMAPLILPWTSVEAKCLQVPLMDDGFIFANCKLQTTNCQLQIAQPMLEHFTALLEHLWNKTRCNLRAVDSCGGSQDITMHCNVGHGLYHGLVWKAYIAKDLSCETKCCQLFQKCSQRFSHVKHVIAKYWFTRLVFWLIVHLTTKTNYRANNMCSCIFNGYLCVLENLRWTFCKRRFLRNSTVLLVIDFELEHIYR